MHLPTLEEKTEREKGSTLNFDLFINDRPLLLRRGVLIS